MDDQRMLLELGRIIRHSSSLPRPNSISVSMIRRAAESFEGKAMPGRNLRFDSDDLLAFVRKNRLFERYYEALSAFGKQKRRCIIVEGADGTGKTSFSNALARRLHGKAYENKSYLLFKKMFGLPKMCKTAAVDYNPNALIAMAFYLVSNAMVIGVASKRHEKFTIIDSSVFRTIACHVVQPDLSIRNAGPNKNHHALCKKLNSMAADAIMRAKSSCIVVFLYADEEVRQKQVRGRGYRDAYDTSSRYASVVSDFLHETEQELRKKNANVFSIDVLPKISGPNTTIHNIVIGRSASRAEDVKKKVDATLEYMQSSHGRFF